MGLLPSCRRVEVKSGRAGSYTSHPFFVTGQRDGLGVKCGGRQAGPIMQG